MLWHTLTAAGLGGGYVLGRAQDVAGWPLGAQAPVAGEGGLACGLLPVLAAPGVTSPATGPRGAVGQLFLPPIQCFGGRKSNYRSLR